MTREGVDFSGAPPSAPALRAAGRDFVVRYARCFTHPKCITAAEAAYWQATGIDVAIVDEAGAGRMLDGYAAGQADASAARTAVRAARGPADGGVVHFACDVDTTTDVQREAAAQFLRGAAAVLGWDRVGVYGEYEVVGWVHDHDRLPVRYLWQTYAWSHGGRHPAATLYQYANGQTLGGVEVDFCRAYAADFGQWGYQEADMPLTDTDVRLVLAGLAGAAGADAREAIAQRNRQVMAADTTYGLDVLRRKLDAVTQAVGAQADDERVILAALAADEQTVALSDAQVAELAAAYPHIDADALATAVRTSFAAALTQ